MRFWRNHWLALASIPLQDLSLDERLADAPRPGKRTSTPEQFCQGRCSNDPRIVALACEAPEKSARPITQGSTSEVAKAIVERGILPAISPRHALGLLKKGLSNWTDQGKPLKV